MPCVYRWCFLLHKYNILSIYWRKESGEPVMYIPTFYFIKNNYSDKEFRKLIKCYEECGAKIVILESGKEEKSLSDNFCDIVKNHI